MSLKIEHREYGPDSSEDEKELILNRIQLLPDNTIYWQEIPVVSVWHIELVGQKIIELSANLDSFNLLVNLTEAKTPNAECRMQKSIAKTNLISFRLWFIKCISLYWEKFSCQCRSQTRSLKLRPKSHCIHA
jgi:hypothetical protein